MTIDQALAPFVDEVRADPASIGLILHGSRATGNHRPDSDYDLIRVVTDEEYENRRLRAALVERREATGGNLDILYQAPSRLRTLGNDVGWWSVTYANAKILVDDTGEVALLVDEIVARARVLARERLPREYDGYLNSFVRSLKARRRGDTFGARLHAAESALYLIRALYALESRWPPYHDELSRELPELEAAQGWEQGYLRDALSTLVRSGDATLQQRLETRVEELMSSRGVAHEWGDDLEPLKRYPFDADAS
jgi:hypothetical protein